MVICFAEITSLSQHNCTMIFRIACDGKCGNEIHLKVRHDRDSTKYRKPGCIQMKEIEVFAVMGKYDISV